MVSFWDAPAIVEGRRLIKMHRAFAESKTLGENSHAPSVLKSSLIVPNF